MPTYDATVIIFNPNSTGDAKSIATQLYDDLVARQFNAVQLKPTQHAGHAEQLAYEAAKNSPMPLVVSVSGDGGYHEVINGVIRSGNTRVVCAVEAAGNANDHWRSVHDGKSLIERIDNEPKVISLLHLVIKGNERIERYAHSYIGLGVSAQVAKTLNKLDLNPLNEKRILLRELWRSQSFRVVIDGKRRRYHSIVAANINEMAKHLQLDSKLRLDSNKFRLIFTERKSFAGLLADMALRTIKHVQDAPLVSEFECTTMTAIWAQCDGETVHIPKGSNVFLKGDAEAVRII